MSPNPLASPSFVLSARPAQYGDTLSFDTKPQRRADLMLVSVRWTQLLLPRSELYWHAIAKNVTAGDTVASIPLFIQKSYFEERFADLTGAARHYWTPMRAFDNIVSGEATFKLNHEFHFGQEDDSGKNRFVVLHDPKRTPSQHRFVPTLITRIGNLLHAIATAAASQTRSTRSARSSISSSTSPCVRSSARSQVLRTSSSCLRRERRACSR
ncbi:hypothetical protein C8T65DRAFT_109708 [Cerioporus squamosus]|nr:hypothetical protein C8T65DRAFT_109708 [Cerioporus squamosus]